MSNLIKEWVKIGLNNPWISESYDPIFDENMFYECKTYSFLLDTL